MAAKCEITGNTVGTDTSEADNPCRCARCQEYVNDHAAAPAETAGEWKCGLLDTGEAFVEINGEMILDAKRIVQLHNTSIRRETAGEMTAREFALQTYGQNLADWPEWTDIAEAFAKQRVEQVESRAVQSGDSDEVEFDTWVRDVESQRPDDHSSMWTAWRDGRALLRAKVADLERERDTLKTAVNQELYDLRTKWNDAESELREMREALAELPLAMLDKEIENIDAAEFVDNAAAFIEAMLKAKAVLARKAGS